MVWKKTASNHVPEWLNIVPLGWRASIWEFIRFVRAGIVFGILAGLVIGWVNDEAWNGPKCSSPDAKRIYDQIK